MGKTTIQRLSELQHVIDEARQEMHILVNEAQPIYEGVSEKIKLTADVARTIATECDTASKEINNFINERIKELNEYHLYVDFVPVVGQGDDIVSVKAFFDGKHFEMEFKPTPPKNG